MFYLAIRTGGEGVRIVLYFRSADSMNLHERYSNDHTTCYKDSIVSSNILDTRGIWNEIQIKKLLMTWT